MGVGRIFSKGEIVDFSRGNQTDFSVGTKVENFHFTHSQQRKQPIFAKN